MAGECDAGAGADHHVEYDPDDRPEAEADPCTGDTGEQRGPAIASEGEPEPTNCQSDRCHRECREHERNVEEDFLTDHRGCP